MTWLVATEFVTIDGDRAPSHVELATAGYIDWFNNKSPAEPSARPRRCARYPMASPTWVSSGFSGVTAQEA